MSLNDAYADDRLKIYIWPAELWNYYLKQRDDILTSQYVVIAENEDAKREVVLFTDEGDLPHLAAYYDTQGGGELLLHEESFYGFDDAMITCRKFYAAYLDDAGEESQADDDNFDEEYCEAEIERREDELFDAFSAFVGVVSDDEYNINEDCALFDDIMELISSYGYSIYRPMFIEVNGEKVFDEFPYDSEVTSSK